MPTAPLPLAGVKVIALEHAIAAPFCTRQLADLGARVIKVERPGVGDFARSYDERVRGLSSHFVWVNRSKESLTLDLKQPQALAVLRRLLLDADVLVQNLAPGAATRLGLSHEALAAENPRLIVCNISGYGDDPLAPGPMRDKKAYDLLIQSEAGFLSVTGSEEDPAKAGCSIADIAAGMYAYSNILVALMERGHTGRGKRIDLSMLESMTEWMGFPLYYSFDGAPPPLRAGAAHATIYPYGPFPVAGGRTVMLGLQNEREWTSFCERVLGQPGLASDPRFCNNSQRTQNRDVLRVLIVEAFASLPIEEVTRRLDAAQIANARVNTMHDLWNHEQLQARSRWVKVGSPVGELPALLPPGIHSADLARMDPIPALGAHTETILTELGYDEKQRRLLRDAGAT